LTPSGRVLLLASCLGILKPASKDNNSGLQMKFFGESEKFWTNSVLALWKRFSGNGSTDWAHELQHGSK
jgi:hypothetical protein